jgi:ribonuclease E
MPRARTTALAGVAAAAVVAVARMRDDSRPHDAFSWVRPWVPYGEDPFVWYDPSEDLKLAPAQPANDAPRAPLAAAAEAATPSPAVASDSGDDIWVELPAADEKPKRNRRARGRGRGRDDEAAPAPVESVVVEAVAEPAPEPEPEPVAANTDEPPAKPKRSRSRKVAAAAEVEAPAIEAVVAPPVALVEPVLAEVAAEPEPAPAPRGPDPNEIAGPPPAPRKGWWRRG